MQSLPLISVAGLNSEDPAVRAETARQLGVACREIGFFYAVDHGIPAEVMAGAFANAKRVFELPLETKQDMSIKKSPHNRGYVAMADEKLNPEAGADMKEAFNIGTDFPADHPDVLAGKPFRGVNFWPPIDGWREAMLGYFDGCLNLGRLVTRGLRLIWVCRKTSSSATWTAPSPPCACCAIRPAPVRSTAKTAAPAPTPTTATSPCWPPTRLPACRC
ncbi:2-oxoglutarate and iron-dependent oxygenase domain-containing protein [Halopseudomonas pachastrellae]|nr:2-oxoglutarate and iron-dependent oxygenase domain-containing protein [Halopseudomonas pachastrellae]